MRADIKKWIESQTGDAELTRLASRAFDQMTKASEGGYLLFTPFLEPEIGLIVEQLAHKYYPELELLGEGAFEDAERQMYAFNPWPTDTEQSLQFPIALLLASSQDHRFKPSHRDVLGSLMGLGIKRERIGDIHIVDNIVYVVVSEEMLIYLEQNWFKIGSCEVTLQNKPYSDALAVQEQGEMISVTVKSLRVDAVVAEGFDLAREKAATLVQNGRCKMNHRVITSKSQSVGEGDLLSVRGYGRLRVSEIGGQTKKDRVWLSLERFK